MSGEQLLHLARQIVETEAVLAGFRKAFFDATQAITPPVPPGRADTRRGKVLRCFSEGKVLQAEDVRKVVGGSIGAIRLMLATLANTGVLRRVKKGHYKLQGN